MPRGERRNDEQLASLRRQRIGYLSQEPAPIEFNARAIATLLAAAAHEKVVALNRSF